MPWYGIERVSSEEVITTLPLYTGSRVVFRFFGGVKITLKVPLLWAGIVMFCGRNWRVAESLTKVGGNSCGTLDPRLKVFTVPAASWAKVYVTS